MRGTGFACRHKKKKAPSSATSSSADTVTITVTVTVTATATHPQTMKPANQSIRRPTETPTGRATQPVEASGPPNNQSVDRPTGRPTDQASGRSTSSRQESRCCSASCGFGILRPPSSYRALEAVVWFQFHQPLASAPARGAAISARGRGGPSALRLALATCGAHCHQRLLHYHCCNGWLLAMHPTHAASPVLRRCRAPCRV